MAKFKYTSEAEMCAEFIKYAEDCDYEAYSETNGYDIFLVCKKTGYQIGVEAKQSFNAKVVNQATSHVNRNLPHPDLICCLVPTGGSDDLSDIAKKLGVTIIRSLGRPINKYNQYRNAEGRVLSYAFKPELPKIYQSWSWNSNNNWFDLAPDLRMKIPDYKPDVIAGSKSPITLTDWKIKAIKIICVLRKRGHLIPKDFKVLKIHQSLWSQKRWIVKGEKRGQWISGDLPDLESQHPTNFYEIFKDFDKWAIGHLKEINKSEQIFKKSIDQ